VVRSVLSRANARLKKLVGERDLEIEAVTSAGIRDWCLFIKEFVSVLFGLLLL